MWAWDVLVFHSFDLLHLQRGNVFFDGNVGMYLVRCGFVLVGCRVGDLRGLLLRLLHFGFRVNGMLGLFRRHLRGLDWAHQLHLLCCRKLQLLLRGLQLRRLVQPWDLLELCWCLELAVLHRMPRRLLRC